MTEGFFVTGTDTGIGKTWSTVALMQYFKNQGKSVVGMKPIASGCIEIEQQLKNEDALLLQKHASLILPYDLINPYAFSEPIAPHIAAEKIGVEIEIEKIVKQYKQLAAQADVVLVEGVGGWKVPLNSHQDIADLAVAIGLPVIMVIGVRLGCINQARLTFSAIKQQGVQCIGWVASCVEQDMPMQEENIASLRLVINAPLLAIFPYLKELSPEYLSQKICF